MENDAPAAAEAAGAPDFVGQAAVRFAATGASTAPPAAGVDAAAGAGGAAGRGQAPASAAAALPYTFQPATERPSGQIQQRVEQATTPNAGKTAAAAAQSAQDFPGVSLWQRDNSVHSTSPAAHTGGVSTATPSLPVSPPQQQPRQQEQQQSAPQQQQRQQRQHQVTPPAAALSCFGALARRREVAKEAAAAASAAQAATGANAAAPPGGGEGLAGGNGGTSQQQHRRSLRVAAGQLEEATAPQSLEWWKICFPTFASYGTPSAHDPASARLQPQQAQQRQVQPQQQPWMPQQQQLHSSTAGGGGPKSSIFSPLLNVSASPSPPLQFRPLYHQAPLPPARLQTVHLRQQQESGGLTEDGEAPASMHAAAQAVWGGDTSSTGSSSVLHCGHTCVPPAAATGTMHPEAGAPPVTTAPAGDAVLPAARVLATFPAATAADRGTVRSSREDRQWCADGKAILAHAGPSVPARSSFARASTCSAVAPAAAAPPFATACAGLDSAVLLKPRPLPYSSSAVDFVCPAAAPASARAAACARAATSAPASPSLSRPQMPYAYPLPPSPSLPAAAATTPAAAAVPLAGTHPAAAGRRVEERVNAAEGAPAGSQCLPQVVYTCAGSPIFAVLPAEAVGGGAAAAPIAAAGNGRPLQPGESSVLITSHSLLRPPSFVRCAAPLCSAAPSSASSTSGTVSSPQQQPWQQQLQQLLSLELPVRNSNSNSLHVGGGPSASPFMSMSNVQGGSNQIHNTPSATNSSPITTNGGITSRGATSNSMTRGVAADDSKPSMSSNSEVAAGVTGSVGSAPCGAAVSPVPGLPTVLPVHLAQKQMQQQQQRQEEQREAAAAADKERRSTVELHEPSCVNSSSSTASVAELATVRRPPTGGLVTAANLSSSNYLSMQDCPNGGGSTRESSSCLDAGGGTATGSSINGPAGIASSISSNLSSSRGACSSSGSVCGDSSSTSVHQGSLHSSVSTTTAKGTLSNSGSSTYSSDCGGSGVLECTSVSDDKDVLTGYSSVEEAADYFFSSSSSSAREPAAGGLSTAAHRWTPPWCITTVTGGISVPQQGPRHACRKSGATTALPSPQATAASSRSAAASAEGSAGAARCSPLHHRPAAATAFHRAAVALPRAAAAAPSTAACSATSVAAGAPCATGLRGALAAGRSAAAASSSGTKAPAAAVGSWEEAHRRTGTSGLLEVEDLLSFSGGSDADVAATCAPEAGDDLLSLEQLPAANLAAVTAARLQPDSMSLRLLQQLLGTLLAGNATVGELTPVGFHVAWMGYQYLQQLQQNPKALLLLVKQQQQQQMQQLQQHAGRCRPAQTSKQQHGLTSGGAGAAAAKGSAQTVSRGGGSATAAAFSSLKQQQQRSTPQQLLGVGAQHQILSVHSAAGVPANTKSRAASPFGSSSGKYASTSAAATAGANASAKGPLLRTSVSRSPSPLSAAPAEGSSGHLWRGGSGEKSRSSSSCGIPEHQQEKNASTAAAEGGTGAAAVGGAPPAAGGRGRHVAGDAVSRSPSGPSGTSTGGKEEQDRQQRQEQQQRRRTQIKKAPEIAAAPLWQTKLGYTDEEWPRYLCGTIDRRWVLQQRNATVPMLQDCNAPPRGRPCKNSGVAAVVSRSAAGGGVPGAATKRETAAAVMTKQFVAAGAATATTEETGSAGVAAAPAARGNTACAGATSGCVAAALSECAAAGDSKRGAPAPPFHQTGGVQGAAGAECAKAASEVQQQKLKAKDAKANGATQKLIAGNGISNPKHTAASASVLTRQDSKSSLYGGQAETGAGPATAHGAAAAVVPEEQEQQQRGPNMQQIAFGDDRTNDATSNDGSSTRSINSGNQRTVEGGKGRVSDERESNKCEATTAAEGPQQTAAGGGFAAVGADTAVTTAAKTCSANPAPEGCNAAALVTPAADGGSGRTAALRNDAAAASGVPATHRPTGSRNSSSSNTSNKGKQRTCLSQYEVSVQFEEFSTVAAELMWPDPLVLPERLYPGLAVQIAYEVRGRFGLWWTDAVLTEVDEAAGLVRCCYVSQHEQDRQQREEERREEKRHQQQRHLQQASDTDAESSGNVELDGIRCSIDRSDSCNKSNKDRGSSALADVSGRSSSSAAKEASCTAVGGEGVADDDGRGAATAAPAKGAPLLNAARGAAAGEATAGATAGADTSATATAGAQQQPRTVLQVKGEKATAGSPQRSRSSRRSSETCDIIGNRDAKQQRAPAPPSGPHHPRQQQNQAEEQQQQQQLQQQGQQFCVGASGLPGFEGARAKPTQTLLVRDFCAPQVPVAAPAAHAWRLLPRAFDPAKDLHPGAVICVSAVAVSLGAAPAPAAQAATGGGAFAAGQKTRRGYAAAVARWHRAQASPAEAAATSEGTEARRWEVAPRKQQDLTSSMVGRAAEAATESRPRTAAAAAEREAREGCGSTAEEECGRIGRGAGRAGWPQQQAVPPYLLRDAVIHRVFQCHTPKIIEAHNALRQQQQKHRKQQPHGEHQHPPRRDCASPGEEREDESHVSNSEMQASGRKPLCSGSTGRSSSSRDSSVKGGMEDSGKEPEPGGSGPDARKGPRGRPPGAGAAASAAAAASARAVAASGAGGLQQAGNCHPASASGSAVVDVAGGNAGAAADQPQNTSAAGGAAAAALVTMPAVLAEEEAVTARTLTDAAEVAAKTRGDGGGVCTGRAAPSEETAAATAKGSLGTAVLGVSPRRPRGRPRKTAVVAEGEENCSTKSSNNSNSSKSCTSSSSGCGSATSRASRSSSSPGRSGSRLVRDADKRQQQEKRQEEKQRQRQQNHGVWKRGSTRGGAWLKSRTRSSSSSSSQHHSGRSPLSKCSRLTRGRGAVTKGVCVSSRAVHTHQVAAGAVSPRRPTAAAAAARRSTSPRPTVEAWAGTAGSDIGATAAAAEEEIGGEKAGSVKRIRRSLCHAGGNVDDRSQQQTAAVTTAAEHSRELAVAPRPAAVEEEGGRRAGLKRNRESTAVPEFPTAAAAACGAPSSTSATKEDAAAGTGAAAPAGEAPSRSSRFIHVSAASASKEKEAATGGERPAAIAVDTDGIVAQSERGTRALLQGSSSSVSGSSSNPPHSSSTYRSSSSGSLNSSSTLVDGSGALPGSGSSSPLSSSSSIDLCPSSRRAQQCYNGLVSEDCSRRPAGETQEEGAADTSPVTYVLLYFPYGDQQRLVSLQRLLNFPCYRLPYDLHAHFPPESGQSVLRQARDFLWAVPRALLPPAAAVVAQCRAANAAALAVANVSTAAASGAPAGGTPSAGNVTAEAGAAGRATTETGATTAQAAEPGTTAAAGTDGGRPGQATAAPKGTGDGGGATVPAVCRAGTAVTGRAAGGSGCEATAAEHANVETATMGGLEANTAAAAEVRVGIPPAAGGSVAAPLGDVGAGAAARESEVGLAVARSMQAESSAAARPPWTSATAAAAMQKQATAEGEAATTGSTLQRICKSEGTVETQQNGGKHTGVPATAGNSSSSSATRNPSSHTKRQTSSKSGLTENGSSKTSSVFCGSFESTGRARLAESGSTSHSNAASPDSAAAVSRSRSKSVEPQQHRRSPGCSAASGSRRNINKQKDDDGVKEEGKATPEGLSQSPFSLVYVALEDSPFKLPQHMHLLQVLQPELDFAALFEGRWQRLLPQWRRRSSASFLEAVPLFHARAAAAEAATAAAADAVASVSSVAAAGTAGACTAATALLSAHHSPTGATAVEPTAVVSLCRAAAVCGAAGTGHCASAAGTQQTAAKAATPGATGDSPLSHAVTQENQPGIAAAGNMHGRSPSGATRRDSALVANSAFASASGSVGEDVAALYASLRPAAAALFRPTAAVALPLSTAVAPRLPPAAAAAAARLTAAAAAAFPAAAAAAPWSLRGREALQAVTTAFASLLESPSAADVAAASTAASRRNFPCLLHHPSDGPPAPWMCTVALSSWIRAGWKPYMLPASFIPRSCASAAVAAAVAAVTTARCTALDVVAPSAAEAALPAGVGGTSTRDTTDDTHSSWRTSNSGADSCSTQSSSGNKSGSTTLYARDSSFLAKVNADEASRGNPFSGEGETAGDLLHSGAAWKRMQSEQQVAATTQQRTAAETTLRSPGTAADGLGVQVGHEEKSSSPAADSSAVSAAAAGGAPAVAALSPLRTALSNEYLSKPQGPFRSTATGRARGSLSPRRERKDVVQQLPQQHQQDDILQPQQHFSQQEMREVERGVRENVEFGPTVWPWAQVETLGGGQQDASVGWTWAALTVYEELLLLRLQQQQQAAAAAAGPRWQLSAPYRSATETFIRKVLDGFPAQQQEEEDMCSDANSGRAWWPTVTETGADADAEATQATQEGLLTRAEGAAFASREKTFGPPLHVTESSSGREEQVTATGSRNRKRPLASAAAAATGAAGEVAQSAAGRRSPKPEEDRGGVCGKTAPPAAATAAGRAVTAGGRGAGGGGAAGGKGSSAGKAAAPLAGAAAARTGKKGAAAAAEGTVQRGGHVEGHVTSTATPSPCSSGSTGSSNSSNACTQRTAASGERSSSSSSIETLNSKNQQESQQTSGVTEAAKDHAALNMHACSPAALVRTRTPLDVLQSAAAQLMREKTLAAGRPAIAASSAAAAVSGSAAKAALALSSSRAGKKGPTTTRNGGKKSFRTLLNGVRRITTAGATAGPRSPASTAVQTGGLVTRTGGEGDGGPGAGGRTTGEQSETLGRGAPGILRGGKKTCGVGIPAPRKHTRDGDTPKTGAAIKKKKEYPAVCATPPYAAARSPHACSARRGTHRLLRKPHGAASHAGRSSSIHNSSGLHSDTSRSCSSATQRSNYLADGGPKSAKEKRQSLHSPRAATTRGGGAVFATAACFDDDLDSTQFAEVRELRLHFSSASVSPPDDVGEATAAADSSQRPAATLQCDAATAIDATAAEGSRERRAPPGEGRRDRSTAATEEGSCATVGRVSAAAAEATKGRSVAAASRTVSCAAASASVGACSSAPAPQRPAGLQRQRQAREKEKNRDGEGK